MIRDTEHRFPQTRWSLVQQAAKDGASNQALSELCQTYWKPLYAFVRRSGWNREDAQDLTQEFLTRVVEREQLASADRTQGKLRSFLLAYLKHFLADQRKAAHAQKRGGGRMNWSLNAHDGDRFYAKLSADSLTPDAAFEQSWILCLLEEVLQKLEENYRSRDRLDLFLSLKTSLIPHGKEPSYAETAAKLGMREGAVKVAAHRLRKHYRDELHARLQDTLSEGESVDGELRYFAQILSAKS